MRQEVEKLEQYNIAEDFWMQKLEAVAYNPIIPTQINLKDISTQTFDQYHTYFTSRLSEQINHITGGSEAKAFLIFLTALNVLSYKYTGLNEMFISTSNFLEEITEDNNHQDVLIFFRTSVNPGDNIKGLLNKNLDELNEVYDNSNYNFESFFRRFCDQQVGEKEAIFSLGLVYKDFNKTENQLIKSIDILFEVEPSDENLQLTIRYSKNKFGKEQIEQMAQHFLICLDSMTENLENSVQQIEILSEIELKKLLEEFSGEKNIYQQNEKTFVPCFEEQVKSSPLATAVVCGKTRLSYHDLNEKINKLSNALLAHFSLQKEDLVAILMERSEEMIISILATWKCGAAYVPIDPDFPDDRIKTIIEDSRTKLLITNSGTFNPKQASSLKHLSGILYLDKPESSFIEQKKTNNPGITIPPNNLSYVIYTSGSTGKPKGVMVEQLGMMNHLYAKISDIQISKESVIAQNASQCFDISVWQFFAALLKGGQTIVYTNQLVLSPGEFINQTSKDGVTILEVVPSYLSMILEIIDEQKIENLFPKLKFLLVTGETVRPSLVKRWFEKYPGIRMVNAYGPTEASDDITHLIMKNPPDRESIPIGSTLRNFKIYIVDKSMNLCPIGIKGEICVSGIGVGRGYLNDIFKTMNAFVEDPFRDNSGHKMYLTGDIGRYLPDGNIEFFGRKDYQVKIRGYRIELEEIENKLSSINGIKEAIVIDKEDQANNKYLCAYITFSEGNRKEGEEIKRQLRDVLPEYMVPANIVILETLPLTPNGKVDRKALPEPDAAIKSSLEYVAPRNATEKKLAEIWKEVLGNEKIGIHDNFFNLGGDSFKGIRIVNKLQEWLQEVVHVTVLFMAPTIEELAAKLENYKNATQYTKVDAEKIKKMRNLIQSIPPLPPGKKPIKKNPPAIFILCPSRSGSTLLRVILTGHPKLFAPQEFELLTFNSLKERKEWMSGQFSFYLEGVIRAIMEIKGCDADEAKEIMEKYEAQDMPVWEFYGILQEWLGDQILIEKTPAYTLDLETIKRAEEYFDSALYIHLIRNPYAVIYSYEKAKLDQIFKYKHNFPARELAEMTWLICHQNILEFLKNVPDNRKHKVKYEELVSNPAEIVAGICKFLGVDFQKEMLQVYQNPNKRMTDGIYNESKMLGDVKFFSHSSINTSSVEKWRKAYKTEFLGEEATHLAKQFGYLKEKTTLDYSKLTHAPLNEHYELSHSQKRLWILNQLDKRNTAYNITNAMIIEDEIDIDILNKVFTTLIHRHESLRTSFINIEGEPRQKILESQSIDFKIEYFNLENNPNREIETKKLVDKEAASPFDLEQAPLMRATVLQTGKSRHVFMLSMHHIISDGWSMQLLIAEILFLYSTYINNKSNPLPPLQFQYKDYAVWQNSEYMQKTLKQQEEYWLKEFEEDYPTLNLPIDNPRPLMQSFTGKIIEFSIQPHESAALKKQADTHGASLFMILSTVFNIFLSKICNQNDIVIGTPIAGRNHPDLERIIGMFVNTLAIRTSPDGEKNFHIFLDEVKEKTLNAFENQDYQFENLVDKLSIQRDMSRNPLFDVMFTLQGSFETDSKKSQTDNSPLNIKPFPYEHTIAKFDLSLSSIEEKDKIVFLLEYSTQLFKQETIQRLITYFKKVISSIIDNPEKPISKIDITTEEEKKRFIFDLNETSKEYPKTQVIQQLFIKQFEKTPDRIALVDSKSKIKTNQITFQELNQRSQQLAQVLKEKGNQTDSIVAIMMERSITVIIGMLGILKAGGAYLPIDPEYPQERISYILSDSNASMLLTDNNFKYDINLSKYPLKTSKTELDIENLHLKLHSINNNTFTPDKLSPENLAYIIYTSGSTGKPKGVLIQHQNVVRLVTESNYIHWGSLSKMLMTGSISFDITTFEIWGSILNGLTLFMVNQEIILDGKLLGEEISKNKIDTLHLIPQLFNQLADQTPEIFAGLKYFLVGGDLVLPHYINKIRSMYNGLNILHMYGPTENTVFSTFHLVDKDYEKTIPIGNPLANSSVYIVDKANNLVPSGISGELLVGGDGVARGYLNNPELTAEKFCFQWAKNLTLALGSVKPVRPSNNILLKHSRTYRTGDLARWQSEKYIEFLGRIDSQVKIRGIRIEIGEVENQILSHPEINEVVVLARKNETEGKYLCAYFVANREIQITEIREFLTTKLPDTMLPAYFMQMDRFPLTSTYKIDRKSLPFPGERPQVATTYVEPQDNLEKSIADIWKEVLSLDKVGIYDNFFDLGGNSLSIIKVNTKLKTELQQEIPVASMFRYPTVESLASYIKQESKDIFADKEIKEAASMMEETMQLLIGDEDE